MQLAHSEYTTGQAADMDNPKFINKLVDYFTKGSSVRHWFEAYAIRRREQKLKLSWNKLVYALRQDYGIRDQLEEHLVRFHSLGQGSDNIQSYIAKKKTAALLVKEHVTPRVLLYSFLQGLRPDVAQHVRERVPNTVEEAQALAIAYEHIRRGNKRKQSGIMPTFPPKRVANDATGIQKPLQNPDQRSALQELNELRRNRCFSCGGLGHRREQCKSSASVKETHRLKIKALQDRVDAQ
jgi:hypothetical protein